MIPISPLLSSGTGLNYVLCWYSSRPKNIPIIHERKRLRWALWSELTKKANDGFHKVCASSMIDVNVWEDGYTMMSMNNKCINIHWLFKAKETAVWSWTIRSAQIPILKMWKWNWETSVKARMGWPGLRLLFYTSISPKIKDLAFHLLSFCIHYTWILSSAALWCKNDIEASWYQNILFHCPMEIILGLF